MKKSFSASVPFLIPLIFLFTLSFASCRKTTQIHLHDRHGLSYDLVKAYAEEHGAVNLILLDYHHDIRPEYEVINSVDWVGKLVEEDYVKKVIWLSGKKLLLPNRNSRMAWLERSLKNTYPETADKMRNAVQLVDWYDLQEIRLRGARGTTDLNGPFVITLDFDVFTKDPGDVPEEFVDELCTWIQKQKPELLTLAFSAAYQPEPEKAWSWLKQFTANYKARANWFLEADSYGEKIESLDEAQARELWEKNPQKFSTASSPLYAGAYLWQNAPADFVDELLNKKISSGNEAASEIISCWQNKKLEEFKKAFPPARMQTLCATAREAANQFFAGADFPPPQQNSKCPEETYGVAVRFRNAEEDRGCLSLYRGVSEADLEMAVQFCAKEALVDPRYVPVRPEELADLYTNISVFAMWEEMSSCYDFVPGVHSLILEDSDGEKTLLQATIALERNYTREEFLARLSNKAGLGLDGWKNNALHFYRAPTVTYTDY